MVSIKYAKNACYVYTHINVLQRDGSLAGDQLGDAWQETARNNRLHFLLVAHKVLDQTAKAQARALDHCIDDDGIVEVRPEASRV